MWIIIFILKVFLWILLAAVALAVLGFLYVFLAPVAYILSVEFEKRLSMQVRIRDPLRLVKMELSYDEAGLQYGVRLAWGLLSRRRGGSEEAGEGEDGAEEEGQGSGTGSGAAGEEDFGGGGATVGEEAREAKSISDGGDGMPSVEETEEETGGGSVESTESHEKTTSENVIRPPRPPREPDERIRPPRDPRPPREPGDETESSKPKRPNNPFSKWKYILTHPDNQRALSLIFNEGMKLVYRMRPRIKQLEGHFSTGEPDWTGQLIGLISICPLLYEDSVCLYPDFESEKAYADGRLEIDGKVRLIFLSLFGLRIILSRDCRHLYRQIRHL
ncbi:MAG: hypothetical protein IJ679_01825 [Lachnospiraceae bacterium]|nr:hypothetical protein [Lachnospiraceae bacterium]